jgi:hypothetical protein
MGLVITQHRSTGRFTVAHSQKCLAVALKYLWCLGRSRWDPPFCPIDRRVLLRAGISTPWTQLDDMHTYVEWLTTLQRVAKEGGHSSLAEWELETYS